MTVFGLQWTQATDVYVRPTCAATAGGATQNAFSHLAVTSPTNAETVAAVAQASANAPWSGMRRCNLWDDGTPTAYYGDRCYTDTDVANMGQCMAQIPKFWYATDHTGTSPNEVFRWFISDTGTETVRNSVNGANLTWNVHPAFVRDSVTKNYIYLSAYEGYVNATKLESKAGVQPTASQTMTQFRTAARLRKDATGTTANYWEQQDFLTTCAVQLLYLVEYGDFKSQTVLSAGITNMHNDANHNQASNTGHTSALGNASGSVPHTFDHVPDSGATTGDAMSYRGIENFYGNLWRTLDGINISNYVVYIADHDFTTALITDPYASSGITLPATDGYISDLVNTVPTCDYTFLPSVTGGTNATLVNDEHFHHAGNNNTIMHGGAWLYGVMAGMFCSYIDLQVDTTANIGSRLMYIG